MKDVYLQKGKKGELLALRDNAETLEAVDAEVQELSDEELKAAAKEAKRVGGGAGPGSLSADGEDLPATIAWFRTPIQVLDWISPRDLILRGELSRVRNLLTEMQSGFAA